MPKLSPKIASLRDRVRSYARPRFKAAELGGGQDVPFEQAFSNLAHAYLRDKAPSLLDYEVGFQLVDRNQESTKAIGVFGFKVGTQWLYAPVFFLNGDLKGHELLYIKNQDMFVPLKENWLNYILNKRPSILGEGVGKNLHDIGAMPPHFSQLSNSPTKFASAFNRLSPWAKEAMPTVAHWATANPTKEDKYKDLISLPAFLKKEGTAVVKSLLRGFQEMPKLAEAFKDFHGLQVIDEALEEAQQRNYDATSSSVLKLAAPGLKKVNSRAGTRCGTSSEGEIQCFDPPKSRTPQAPFAPKVAASVLGGTTKCAKVGEPLDEGVSAAGEEDKLKIYTYDAVLQHGTGLEGLNDKERSKLLKEKVLIKDDRKETVTAYEVQSQLKLTNPTETGLYDLLVRPSKFEKCLVIIGPYTNQGRKDFCTIINVEESKGGRAWTNTHPSQAWVANQYKREDFQEWWEKLEKLESLPTDSKKSVYVAIGNTGDGTLPFIVDTEYDDAARKSYDVQFRSTADKERAGHLPALLIQNEGYKSRRGEVLGYANYSRIVLTGKRGSSLKAYGEELLVPGDYRLLKLSPSKGAEADGSCKCVDEKVDEPLQKDDSSGNDKKMFKICTCGMTSDPPALIPGSQLDVDLLLGVKTASVKIYDSGTEVEINGRRMQKLAGLIHLVRDWGMREKLARVLLKRANEKRVTRFRIKKADPSGPYELQRSGPSAPGFPEPPMGDDMMTGGRVPVQNMGEWNQPIPELSAQNTDPSLHSPESPPPDWQPGGKNNNGGAAAPDSQTQQMAMQAAQTGQKEIFDTAMIGSLLKAVRDDSMVDRYMGDLMKGLDRLGRILFLFYWHGERFKDRYGANDMIELEDGLRNAFESLGDVVLFLKQRSVQGGPEDMPMNLSEIGND